jgi:hypothetical protein
MSPSSPARTAGCRRRRVQVVVLGDFGRSPRMQYHALSLASQADMMVDVVAYEGSTPRGKGLHHPGTPLNPQPSTLEPRLSTLNP